MGYFQYFQHLPTSWALKGGPMWEALAGFSKSFQYSEKQSCRHFKWGSLSDTLHCDKSAWRSLRPKQTSCIDPANGTWSAATCCNIEWLVSTPTDVLLKATVYGGNGAWKESDYRIGMNEAACHRPSNPARDLDLQYWLELNFALNHSLMLQGELAQPSAPATAKLLTHRAKSPVCKTAPAPSWEPCASDPMCCRFGELRTDIGSTPVTILIHQIQNMPGYAKLQSTNPFFQPPFLCPNANQAHLPAVHLEPNPRAKFDAS